MQRPRPSRVVPSALEQISVAGASGLFAVVRLANDQTLENVTGQGAPPWTWPRDELLVDVLHKCVYAFTTGAIADALAADPPAWREARRPLGQRLLARARPG